MASESVTILINAENQASAELKKVGQDLEGMSKRAKEVGRNTKASVEIAGTLANAFGGTAIGAFASQMAQVTERVSAFSEVAKTGTAGAMAFKLGLVAAAGAVTYKVAETVAAWWFEIDKAKEKAAEAEKAFAGMSNALGGVRQRAFAQTKEDIGLIRDKAERDKATAEAAAKLEKQSRELSARIAREESNAKDDVGKDQVANLKSIREELDKEAQSLRDNISQRAKSVEARKAENALKDKSEAFISSLQEEVKLLKATKEERLAIEAAKNAAPEDQAKAKALLVEREALKAKAEEQKKAEVEAEQAAKKEQDAIARTAEMEKKRLIDLEARRIELVKGREAAQAYRLEQDGLSKATAERLAAAEEVQRREEEAANKAKSLEADSSPQTAVQGRLLTKGTGGDPAVQMINALKELIQVGRQQLKQADDYNAQKARGFTVKTAVVP